MKKTAVLLYDSFCNFELSVALGALSLGQKEIVVFGKNKLPIKSEEGLTALPDQSIAELNIDEFDSLLLTGAADIREAIEDERMIAFIRQFEGKIIGAISIAPILLVKAGLLNERPFIAGVNREELYEEGFDDTALSLMIGWDDLLQNPIEDGYLITDQIITSVSYGFVEWGLAFARMLGLDVPSNSFGL